MLATTLAVRTEHDLKDPDQAQKTIRDSRRLTNFNELRKSTFQLAAIRTALIAFQANAYAMKRTCR